MSCASSDDIAFVPDVEDDTILESFVMVRCGRGVPQSGGGGVGGQGGISLRVIRGLGRILWLHHQN